MTQEIEEKARELGWSPKEEFRGDPEKWIDAETFVRRGEELMPLLKATTRKQSEKIATLEASLKKTTDLLAAATDSIEALKESTSKAAIKEVKAQHEQLKQSLKEAKQSGDVDAELEIQDKLQETREALKEAEAPAKPVKKEEPVDFTQTPEWKAWHAENPWFGQDKRKTALALGISQDLRANGETAVGKAFYDKVTEEMNAMLGTKAESRRESPSKVEGDTRGSSSSGGRGNGKSYEDLPAEAKAACERQSKRLVGEGRAFKTIGDWRKHYTNLYFEE